MIKYNLKCKNNHEFESWFSSSKEYEKLKKKNFIECVVCKSKSISKSIMSPRVLSFQSSNKKKQKEFIKDKKNLLKVRKFVEKNFEFVGENFSREIKNIYYDKKKSRNIYGTTTQSEREELKEEGIETISVPWIEREN